MGTIRILNFHKRFEEMRELVRQLFWRKNIHDREISSHEEYACLFEIYLFIHGREKVSM